MGALGGGGGLMKAWFDCLIGANLNIVACLTAKENKLQDFYEFKMIWKINWHCWQIMCTRWRLLLPPGAWHFLTLMCWVMWPGMVVFIPIYYLELLEGLEVVHYGSCRVFVSYSKHLSWVLQFLVVQAIWGLGVVNFSCNHFWSNLSPKMEQCSAMKPNALV